MPSGFLLSAFLTPRFLIMICTLSHLFLVVSSVSLILPNRSLSKVFSPHLFSVWPSVFVLLSTVYPLSVPVSSRMFSVLFSLSLCSFPFSSSIQCLLSVPLRSHTQIHLVLLFISLPINQMFPSSLLFSSHVFNLSLSLSSSITHPRSYPAVTV